MKNQSLELNAQAANHPSEISAGQGALQTTTAAKIHAGPRLSLHALSLVVLSLAFGIGGSAIPAAAGPFTLKTSGQLTLPSPCNPGSACGTTSQGTFPSVSFANPLKFKGTWSAPVAAGWQGYYSGTGHKPDGLHGTGLSYWDFSNVGSAGNGYLPAGTIVYFGDLDGFSGDETFNLTATFLNNSVGPWLESPFYCSGPNFSSECVQGAMPEYKYNGNGSYTFDGNNVKTNFNPNLGVWLRTNQPIDSLIVDSTSTNASFHLAAPVPEPGSLLLMGSGVLGLGGLLRRRLLG